LGDNRCFPDRADERRSGWSDVAHRAYIPVSENFTLDEIWLWLTRFGAQWVMRRSERSYLDPHTRSGR
jgi:hypothetical protein